MKSWHLSIAVVSLLAWNSYVGAALPSADDFSPIKNSILQSNSKALQAGSIISLNHAIALNGRYYSAGTELIVDQNGDLSTVEFEKDQPKKEQLVDAGININELTNDEFMVLNQDESTGEITPYNLTNDFEFAGPTVKKTKRSGVTNCYHVVKILVRDRISLYGVAAYMAAPQLKAAGWHRYADYDSAPEGSVCVFNKGGIQTSSGGHIYGHVGVKGASGIANPTSGFHLKRPFLGCWNEV